MQSIHSEKHEKEHYKQPLFIGHLLTCFNVIKASQKRLVLKNHNKLFLNNFKSLVTIKKRETYRLDIK
ncbi:hypothetical protein Q7O_001913 [Pectobacterium carotovorum subsp. carotovorum PCCS1]|nr:hypothetical protein [Pectobacterium carotovorum subsp. carotovorum PCCS1]